MISLNGAVGVLYHAPFPVLARAGWGFWGSYGMWGHLFLVLEGEERAQTLMLR